MNLVNIKEKVTDLSYTTTAFRRGKTIDTPSDLPLDDTRHVCLRVFVCACLQQLFVFCTKKKTSQNIKAFWVLYFKVLYFFLSTFLFLNSFHSKLETLLGRQGLTCEISDAERRAAFSISFDANSGES